MWAKGSKPSNAGEGDAECKESTWGVGANITTKLVNPAGEVPAYDYLLENFILYYCGKFRLITSIISCERIRGAYWQMSKSNVTSEFI